MTNKEQKNSHSYEMISNFKWDIKSGSLVVWFVSTCVSLLDGLRQNGDYTSLYLWLLSLGIGYCFYMFSLAFGEFITYKILRASGIHSGYERALVCESIIDSVQNQAYCEAYKVYDKKTKKFKGAVVVITEQDIDIESIQNIEQRQLVDQTRELLIALSQNEKKKQGVQQNINKTKEF